MRDLYRLGVKPVLAEVPPATFIAVRGNGAPNDEVNAHNRRSAPCAFKHKDGKPSI